MSHSVACSSPPTSTGISGQGSSNSLHFIFFKPHLPRPRAAVHVGRLMGHPEAAESSAGVAAGRLQIALHLVERNLCSSLPLEATSSIDWPPVSLLRVPRLFVFCKKQVNDRSMRTRTHNHFQSRCSPIKFPKYTY